MKWPFTFRWQELSNDADSTTHERARALFERHQARLHRATDRIFAGLILVQWAAAVVAALVITPRTWIGDTAYVHLHVWASIVLGGAISSLPVALAFTCPGRPLTRHVIAIAQMLWSALLIHLSGGRIETHFHVFGSLAVLAFYRDWKVLVTATVVVAVDHFVRGIWWPQSVFGVLVESPYRWIEHAAWVTFEDVFLMISIHRSLYETWLLCDRQAELEATNRRIDSTVQCRTRELSDANAQLRSEIAERRRAEAEREAMQEQLLVASRQAGMAEVATGVLHNVGNVLNSAGVSLDTINERLKSSHLEGLLKATDMLDEHLDDLPDFLTHDDRGCRLPRYLKNVALQLAGERDTVLGELDNLGRGVSHIKQIISMQQAYSCLSGYVEELELADVLEEALRLNDASMLRHGVEISRHYDDVGPLVADRHRLLQIFVNLISNAKHALTQSAQADKRLVLRITRRDPRTVRVEVTDNGIGIPKENLTRIFWHGFTTKSSGYGYGLHISALAAQEMEATLTAHSDGPGRGATFVLEINDHAEESTCTAATTAPITACS